MWESPKWRISRPTFVGCPGVGSNRNPVGVFDDETKRIGISIGQAEDEKSQAKDEKIQVTAGTS